MYLIQTDYITTSIIHIISVVPVLSTRTKIISEPATFIWVPVLKLEPEL